MLSDWWVIAMRELCALLSSQVTPTTHNTTQTAHKQHIYITQAPHEQHTNNIAAVATPFIFMLESNSQMKAVLRSGAFWKESNSNENSSERILTPLIGDEGR
jgi:hypothetical protein